MTCIIKSDIVSTSHRFKKTLGINQPMCVKFSVYTSIYMNNLSHDFQHIFVFIKNIYNLFSSVRSYAA